MDVTPLIKSDAQVIQSYAGGQFRVSGQIYQGAIIVTPTGTIEWDCADFDSLNLDHFTSLIEKADEIDVVLLGCGPIIQFLKPDLRNALKEKGLSIDVMDTGAACRTYNVLMAEGRRVAAALLPI